MSMVMLDAALRYADNGWRVFPLIANGKTPATEHGCKDATTDETQIREWFGNGRVCNLGIATGAGLLVVDVDVKHGVDGFASLAALQLGDTRTASTPSGGQHRYYTVSTELPNSAGALGPGVDTRGDGGYVVAPPSAIDGKPYSWEDDLPTQALPDATVRRLLESRAPGDFHELDGKPVPIGQQETVLNQRACSYRYHGLSRGGAIAALWTDVETWPQDPQREPWTLADVEAKVARAWRDIEPGAEDAETAALLALVVPRNSVGVPTLAGEPQTETADFTLTHIGDLLAEPDEAVDWLVADLLPMGGLAFIGAKPKVGKSTFCRSLAVAVARGDEFLGRRCAMGGVVYLALEEKRSEVRRHFRALGADGEDALFVHVAKAPRDALAAMLRLIRKHSPILVVIDPLLRFTRVRDESAYAELSNALEGVMAAARETNCCILASHHSPKAQSAETIDSLLGSTALSGAPDTVLVLRRKEKERTIESVQRYGPDMERQILEMDPDTGVLSLGGTVAAVQDAATQRRVLELLADGMEMTTDELREAADVRKAAIVAALRVLCDAGEVSRDGSGVKGAAYRYRLAKSDSFAVPNPTPGTAERNPEMGGYPLDSNDLFRSEQGAISAQSPERHFTSTEEMNDDR